MVVSESLQLSGGDCTGKQQLCVITSLYQPCAYTNHVQIPTDWSEVVVGVALSASWRDSGG